VLDQYPTDVKLVPKNFPLSKHKFARKAAMAALAANNQGKFWDFHNLLYENYKSINDTKIEDIAIELGLDMEKFAKDRESQAVKGLIARDINDAMRIGVRGTPSVFINGKVLRNRSLPGFKRMITAEIEKRK
jgi:protein-disulfide isomerase